MDAPTLAVLKRIGAARKAIQNLPTTAAMAYVGLIQGQGDPIVDDRFKGAGNKRFPPLTYAYAREKSGQSLSLQRQARKERRKGSKLIDVGFTSSTGTLRGFGSSKNLPILVRTGKMRQAVLAKQGHSITQSGSIATITFRGLPDYALYHHTGSGKLPVRSPVEPNLADIERVKAAVSRRLTAVLGKGANISVSRTSVLGIARVI
jgi:hypothetical protein